MKSKFVGRWLYPLAIIVALVLFWEFLTRIDEPIERDPKATTELRLVILATELEGHYRQDSSFPKEITVILENKPETENEYLLEDGWGNEFRYSTDSNKFELTSSGEDEEFDTEDDIIHVKEFP